MAFLGYKIQTGQIALWEAGTGKDPAWNQVQPIGGTIFTALSYDPAFDSLIVARGPTIPYMYRPGFSLIWAIEPVNIGSPGNMGTVSYNPENITVTRGSVGHIEFPHHGNSYGFVRDPNTGNLNVCAYDFVKKAEQGPSSYGEGDSIGSEGAMVARQTVSFLDLGAVKYEIVTSGGLAEDEGAEYATATGIIITNETLHNYDLHQWLMEAFGGAVTRFPNAFNPVITPNVIVFDDVSVFMFMDQYNQAFISAIRLGRQGKEDQWVGSRYVNMGIVIQLMPIGIDRGLAVGYSASFPEELIGMTFRYDRTYDEIVIENVETIPYVGAVLGYTHIGQAAYDTKRQQLIILGGDGDTLYTFTNDNLCHAGVPISAAPVVAMSAVHAEQTTDFAVYAMSENSPGAVGTAYISWGSTPLTYFSAAPPRQVNIGQNGVGIFTVNWSSAASGQAVTPVVYFSSYSVAQVGASFEVTPMTVIASSQTFVVSAGVSASTPTGSLNNSIRILSGRPALESDSIGAGTPQELAYPNSDLNTPLVFELNPQIWTNMAANALTRPIYAAQRTLTKTANVQFKGDVTDLEVKLTWMGGERVAMTLAFFSQLWNYYWNSSNLDFTQSGYIRWSPKDLNNHTYDVIITNLEVGIADGIQLDSLYKALDGYVHDTVTLTMRIISEVS
jgi:hypothetical protein